MSNITKDDEVERIREAVELSLREWAVDRRVDSDFCEVAIRRALKYSQQKKEPNPLDMAEF